MAVGVAHGGWGVIGGDHELFDEVGEEFLAAGGGGLGWRGCSFEGDGRARGEFIEADGDGLAQVHGRLGGVGGDLDQDVAVGEVFAGEAVFFRAEDEGYAAGDAGDAFAFDEGSEMGKGNYRLFGLAVGQGSGAGDESAMGHGFGESFCPFGVLQKAFCADSGFHLLPMRFPGGDDGETRETEVGQGAGCCADVERIARGDEDDFELGALG